MFCAFPFRIFYLRPLFMLMLIFNMSIVCIFFTLITLSWVENQYNMQFLRIFCTQRFSDIFLIYLLQHLMILSRAWVIIDITMGYTYIHVYVYMYVYIFT